MRPDLDVAAQQLADDEVLLRPRQQPWHRLPAQRRVGPEQAERVGVEGSGDRLADGTAEPHGDALAEFGRRAAAEREHERLLRRDLLALDALHDRLDDHGCLAGARAGEHQEGAAAVLDRGPLRVVQHRDRDGSSRRRHEPQHRLVP